MGYLRDIYGLRSNEFIDGMIAGVEAYAVWRDGVQLVGAMERSLREVIKEIKEEMEYKDE